MSNLLPVERVREIVQSVTSPPVGSSTVPLRRCQSILFTALAESDVRHVLAAAREAIELPIVTIDFVRVPALQEYVGKAERYVLSELGKCAGAPCCVVLDGVCDVLLGERDEAIAQSLLRALCHFVDSVAHDWPLLLVCACSESTALSLPAAFTRHGRYADHRVPMRVLSEDETRALLGNVSDSVLRLTTALPYDAQLQLARGGAVSESDAYAMFARNAQQLVEPVRALVELVVVPNSAPRGNAPQLVGIDEQVARTTRALLAPHAADEHARRVRIGLQAAAARSVLLCGPPGSGKSALFDVVCERARRDAPQLSVISCHATALLTSVVGESEKRVRTVFAAARSCAPCILFIDHVEAIARKRGRDLSTQQSGDRLLSCLLEEIDGVFTPSSESKISLLCTTTTANVLDPAFVRGGRVAEIVSLPDEVPRSDRVALMRQRLSKLRLKETAAEEMVDRGPSKTVSLIHWLQEALREYSREADAVGELTIDKLLEAAGGGPDLEQSV